MTTSETIERDIRQALTGHDELMVSVLRLVKSELHNFAIAKKKKEEKLTEEDVVTVLSAQAKQCKDSIAAYEQGDRPDLASREKKELEIIEKYLPEQLSDEEIKKVVQAIVESVGSGASNFGAVMGQAMARLKGKADGTAVSRIVKEALG